MNPYPAVPTVESSIGRTPIGDNSVAENNAKIYSTYEPSSQLKYSANKYVIAENIQNALRQQSAYAQVGIAHPKNGEAQRKKKHYTNTTIQFHKYFFSHIKCASACFVVAAVLNIVK